MMASSKTRSNFIPEKIHRSISPSRTFCSSAFFASSITRSSSKNRASVDHDRIVSKSPSVRFSIDRGKAAVHSSSIASSSSSRERIQIGNHRNSNNKASSNGQKKSCMCSPTTHPGSFRCSLHRNVNNTRNVNQSNNAMMLNHWQRVYVRRSAMTNSIVRIGTVEGDLVKRCLASLIRPSSHKQKPRGDFQPKPSRLSIMSKADES